VAPIHIANLYLDRLDIIPIGSQSCSLSNEIHAVSMARLLTDLPGLA
jgi:hypothetical protein